MDLELQYNAEPNLFASQNESFNVRAMAGNLSERSTTTAAGICTNFAKRISTPEFTPLATVNYTIADYGIMLQSTSYNSTLSNGNNEGLTGPTSNWVEGRDVEDNTVAS